MNLRRVPEAGGIMNGGPLNGRIMAYSGPLMPCYDDTGKRIGSYIWDEDHWEYDSEQGTLEDE